jgi:hypothetical protein
MQDLNQPLHCNYQLESGLIAEHTLGNMASISKPAS